MPISIPKTGKTIQEIIDELVQMKENDADWEKGKIFSLVFHHSKEHTEVIRKAYELYLHENGLNPMAFLSLKRMEKEVVQMTSSLLNGDERTVGCMTSGGTESILLAMKTYRDKARAERKDPHFIPEIILPVTAHVAFEKAGQYFDIKMVHAPVDSKGKVDVDAVERRITSKTVAIVASVPNYPTGTVDPIEDLSALAVRYGLGLHVDACIGGFVLPWFERLGERVPLFDFRVPGVTSISVDVHKYGYSAKGASVILYRDISIMRHQLFVYVDWPGGIFMSPGILGTRPGGAIASAWASIMHLGEAGYLENAQKLLSTVKQFQNGIRKIPELDVVGEPIGPVFAYCSKSKDVNIYAVADQMESMGWFIDRQQKPPSIHLMINPIHSDVVDLYLQNLAEAVRRVKENPSQLSQSKAPMYGMMANVPLRGLVKTEVLKIIEKMFTEDTLTIDIELASPKNGINVVKKLFEYLTNK